MARMGVGAALAVVVAFGLVVPASAQVSMRAVVTGKAPLVDGDVTDAEWTGAPVASNFVQFEPRRGDPSPFRTDALVLYDTSHVYFAFRVWDPEPLTAQLTQRDAQLDRDDAVGVLIDTFHDGQSGYYFAVNALGTQADARIGDDGRTADFNWDTAWKAAVRRAQDGWTAEIAVPLTSVRYVAGAERSWGSILSGAAVGPLNLVIGLAPWITPTASHRQAP